MEQRAKLRPITISGIAALCMAMSACDGPAEKAGKAQDKAAANASGVAYTGEGPAQRLGEAKDRADGAAADARDAAAQALETQADARRKKADLMAEKLEEQAKAIRDKADVEAEALEKRAKAARKGE